MTKMDNQPFNENEIYSYKITYCKHCQKRLENCSMGTQQIITCIKRKLFDSSNESNKKLITLKPKIMVFNWNTLFDLKQEFIKSEYCIDENEKEYHKAMSLLSRYLTYIMGRELTFEELKSHCDEMKQLMEKS